MEARAVTWVYGHYKKNMLLLGPMDDSSEDRPFFKFLLEKLEIRAGNFRLLFKL